MAEQIAALSALLGQQLDAEGWGQEAAAAAVLAAGGPGQLEPLLQVSLRVRVVCVAASFVCTVLAAAMFCTCWHGFHKQLAASAPGSRGSLLQVCVW
jgi:hypothetical protein